MPVYKLCLQMEELGASDLFFNTGHKPMMRQSGNLLPIPDAKIFKEEEFYSFLANWLPAGTKERFEKEKSLDIGLTLEDSLRFRLSLAFQQGLPDLIVRKVPSGNLHFEELRIPLAVQNLAEKPRGLLLIAGTTGSGKSTTMATMVNHINENLARHIITLEDPIEFLHKEKQSLISQREVGSDTKDFPTALKHIVRQNPDVIIIGELRDSETCASAVSAALTGHLVIATLHAADAQQALERMLNFFPERLREQSALDLAYSLQGIISQRLLPAKDEKTRIPAFEIFLVTPQARRVIANRAFSSIPELIKAGAGDGMLSFNRSLLDIYKNNLVELEFAAQAATNKEEFLLLTEGMETGVDTFRRYSNDPAQGISIRKLLHNSIKYAASDLLLTVDSPPVIRLDGDLHAFDMPLLSSADTQVLLHSILTAEQRADFAEKREIDFALSLKGIDDSSDDSEHRFRVNAFYQKGKIAVVFRLIPMQVPAAESLGLPKSVIQLASLRQGLVLVTGPTGHGKSTTLAALIDIINNTRPCHIITIEDPIEFVHEHKQAIVEQREVKADTISFNGALKYILRQSPDVILIGEMRDPETISAALTAAETGHLVLATLHTNDVAQSIDRIIDVFPSDQQNQVRSQFAASLAAIVAQRLLPKAAEKTGRVAAFEVLIANIAVKAMIRDKKTHQLKGLMETAAREGMITMERALKNLYEQKAISKETYQQVARF